MASAAVQANKQRITSVPWKPWQALVAFVGGWVVVPAVAAIALGIATSQSSKAHELVDKYVAGDPAVAFVVSLVSYILFLGVVAFFLRRSGATWRDLGLRRFSLVQAILTIVLLFVAFTILIGVVYALITALDPHFDANQPQTNEFTGAPSGLGFWALVIIPPIAEETIFRGFLFPGFARRFGIPIGAIFSSLLFGLAHLQGNVSVYTFVFGLLLCWLYVRLGSIIPGIGLHMLNNYLAYTALTSK